MNSKEAIPKIRLESGEQVVGDFTGVRESIETQKMNKGEGRIDYGEDKPVTVGEGNLDSQAQIKSLQASQASEAEPLEDGVESKGSGSSDGLSSASENLEILEKWLPEIRPKFEDLVNNPGLAKIAESID